MTIKKTKAPPARRPPARKKTPRGPQKKTQPKGAPKAVPAPPPPPPPLGSIVVDGSNVAMQRLVDGKPTIETIRRTHDELVKLGYGPVIFVDASLRHRFPENETKAFEKWYQEGYVIQAPKGVPGDEAILEFASRKNAPILSNDTYEDYKERYPWISDRTRRIPFNLVHGELLLYLSSGNKEPRQAHSSAPPPPPQQKQERQPPARPQQPSKEERRRILGEKLVEAYNKASKTGEPIIIDDFLRALRQIYPNFRPSDYGYQRPSQMIADFPDLLAVDRRSDHGEVAGVDGPPEWPLHVCPARKKQ